MRKVVYPVVVALGIRLALAPWFMHPWDLTTVMMSSNQFLSGVNPYTYVQQQAQALQAATGQPVPFFGFAYSATTLLMYAPFYELYRLLGFAALPLTGWQGQPGQVMGLVYPDAFAFLFLMKIPVIAADTVAVWLLYKRNPRLGWAYALSPYVIVITSVLGEFDPLVGVLLLIAYLEFDRSRFWSGFAFGLSMMKFYTVAAAPVFLLGVGRKPKELAAFLAGAFVANLPSMYYLLVDPSSFMYAIGFQATRAAGGVNIWSDLIALNSVSLQLQAANVVSLVFVAALVVAVVASWKSHIELKESIVLLMLVYMVFAPVTNEQLLAAVLPLGLLARNFSHKLAIFPLAFLAFNNSATFFYLATPILFQSPALISVFHGVNAWWGGATGPYVIQARYFIGGAAGVAAFLMARSTFGQPLRLRLSLSRKVLGQGGREL